MTTWAARCLRASTWPTKCALTPRVSTADDRGHPSHAARARPTGSARCRRARACDPDTSGTQLLEVNATAVERHHAHVEAALAQTWGQGRPLPLCAARLEVGAYERDLLRGLVRSSREPHGEETAIDAEHSFRDWLASIGMHGFPQSRITVRAKRPLDRLRQSLRVALHDCASWKAGDYGGDVPYGHRHDWRPACKRLLHHHRRALPHRSDDGHVSGVHRKRNLLAGQAVEAGREHARLAPPQPVDHRVEDVDALVRDLRAVIAGGRETARRARPMATPVRAGPRCDRAAQTASRSTAHGITGASRTPKFAAIIGATAIGWVRLATSRDTLRCHGTQASLPWNVVTTGVASWRDAIAPESP